MSRNRIPRRVLSERDRVLARARQQAAYETYLPNILAPLPEYIVLPDDHLRRITALSQRRMERSFHRSNAVSERIAAEFTAEHEARQAMQAAMYLATTGYEVPTWHGVRWPVLPALTRADLEAMAPDSAWSN